MPTERDRLERRRAEARLAASYAWPEAPRRRVRWMRVGMLVSWVILVLAGAAAMLANVFGWRP